MRKVSFGVNALTTKVSVAVLPVSPVPLVAVTAPVVLILIPSVDAVTSTCTIQVPPAGIVAFAKLSVVPSPAAVTVARVGSPLSCSQVVLVFGAVALTMSEDVGEV